VCLLGLNNIYLITEWDNPESIQELVVWKNGKPAKYEVNRLYIMYYIYI
jgi:hypothetical protein